MIDSYNNIIVVPQWMECGNACNGIIPVKNSDIWSISDYNGNIIKNTGYEWISEFHANIASYISQGKFGVVNREGIEILEAKYLSIDINKNGIILAIDENEITQVFNSTGKYLTSYESVHIQFSENENYLYFEENGLKGLMDFSGYVIIPANYEYIHENYNSIVAINGTICDYYDIQGNSIINIEADQASPFCINRAVVIEGSRAFIIDTEGNQVGSDEWVNIIITQSKYALAQYKNHGYTYINTHDGSIVTEGHYDIATSFYFGYALAYIESVDLYGNDTSTWYIINENFEKIIHIAGKPYVNSLSQLIDGLKNGYIRIYDNKTKLIGHVQIRTNF